jgi:hypothetical protein
MASYLSVERTKIQTAFALAHKLAGNENVSSDVRREALKISTAIWQACGEPDNEFPRVGGSRWSLPEGFPGTEKDHV